MRTRVLLACLAAGALTWSAAASADVNDAERAAARDLFKQGDELQRAGKFADALDKFQRAQQVIQAPTNVLRIAECQAALGKLVESAESYRTVIRWTLPPGSPPAFQAAVDQAKGELAQVDPRVPKVTVQATPSNVQNAQLVIDGTAMPGALIGVPVPIDPGTHKIQVSASGYSSAEQTVTLKEHDAATVNVKLELGAGTPIPPAAPPPPAASGTATDTPPPPPAYGTSEPPQGEAGNKLKEKNTSLMLGGHLGLEIPAGKLPLANPPPGGNGSTDIGNISGAGGAIGIEGGVRFARHFYLGLSLEYAGLSDGKHADTAAGVTGVGSNTAAFGLVGAYVLDPQRVTLYAQVSLDARSYSYWGAGSNGTQTYGSGEIGLGLGAWIPVDRWLRLIPLATVSFGSFGLPANSNAANANASGSGQDGNHAFFMIGLMGLTNIGI